MTDIIIPIYNEEKLLRGRAEYFYQLARSGRLIFADGQSTDQSLKVAACYGNVVAAGYGRALQMNEAAHHSCGEYLVFLHADTCVSAEALKTAQQRMSDGAAGGCFRMQIEEPGVIYRIFENLVNFRARHFAVLDGDLGLFVRRDIFEHLGGFDDCPVMEDLLFARKLRWAGPVVVLDQPILVSARRWKEDGFFRTFLQYSTAYIRLWTGNLYIEKNGNA